MHELSLARDLLAAIERNLDRPGLRVVRVNLSVGSASGVASDSLRFAFRALAEGTCANGAELAIATVPARCRCGNCGTVFDFGAMIGHCPACARLGGELVSGNEMLLQAIEVTDV